MTAPAWVNDIEARRGTKLVLLVEGKDDRDILGSMLRRMDRNYTKSIKIFETEGREKVLKGLACKNQPTDGWWGIIDRDEATDAEVASLQSILPTLRVLPRYCIESFFVDPDEVWPLIPPPKKAPLADGVQQIKNAVEPEVDKWVAHWAMWCVIRKKRKELLEKLRFPDELLERMTNAVLTEAEIKTELGNWHNHLTPDPIHAEYANLESSAAAEPLETRYRRHVHGKKFFEGVVSQKGLRLIQQRAAADWLLDLAESIARGRSLGIDVPSDLRNSLQNILDAAATWPNSTRNNTP
jgi:hypothetical protein